VQLSDPALNDAMLRRFPDAAALTNARDRSTALGKELVDGVQAASAPCGNFTASNLMTVPLFWLSSGHRARKPNHPGNDRFRVVRQLNRGPVGQLGLGYASSNPSAAPRLVAPSRGAVRSRSGSDSDMTDERELSWETRPRENDVMTSHLLSWAGVDDPSRWDLASVELDDTSMRAIGSACARNFSSSWYLDVGPGWVTRTLRVTTRGFGWSRSLDLERSNRGEWTAVTNARGKTDLPSPGLADPGSLTDAIDCDLGLCPVTNTMPIRRLGLLTHDVEATPLVMAWVEMPSLRVVRSDQVYASGPADDRHNIRYTSFSRDFSASLTVDADGLVLDYPSLARRVD
jgi:hypothetical protein